MISGRTKLVLKNYVKQTPVGRYLRNKYQRIGNDSKENAEKTLIKYLDSNIGNRRKNELINDMITESTKYDIAFYEYMMYHFYEKGFEERREYVSALERTSFCERMNNMKNVIIFDDKGRTYEKYQGYYKRDLISIFSGG